MLFVPTFVPFFLHWYIGVEPPLVGVAVNDTIAPAHTVVDVVATLTEGTGIGFTVIVLAELFADAHTPLVTTARYKVVEVRLVYD